MVKAFYNSFGLRAVIVVACIVYFHSLWNDSDVKTSLDLERVEEKANESFEEVVVCKSLFTINKGGHGVFWETDDEYERLSLSLPSLLEEKHPSVGDRKFYKTKPETRLHLATGRIPYIPCQIVEYDSSTFRRCCRDRRTSGSSNWIAFVGDSTARVKALEFLSFLPQNLRYKYFVGNKEVTKENAYLGLAYYKHRPPNIDIFGYLPTKKRNIKRSSSRQHGKNRNENNGNDDIILYTNKNSEGHFQSSFPASTNISYTHIPNYAEYRALLNTRTAPFNRSRYQEVGFDHSDILLNESDVKSRTYEVRLTVVWKPFSWRKSTRVKEWAEGEFYPDVVTFCYGFWLLGLTQDPDVDNNMPFTTVDKKSRDLIQLTSKLASKTRVLVWSLSKARWFVNEDVQKKMEYRLSREYFNQALRYSCFEASTRLLSTWLWRNLRGTGAWYWDSSVPFSIANVRECETLSDAGDYNHTFYHGMWWLCKDDSHPSYETIHNEMQMLLNLLCNEYVANDRANCCSKI